MAVIRSNVLKMTVLLGVISSVCKNNMVAMFVQYVMYFFFKPGSLQTIANMIFQFNSFTNLIKS